MIPVIICGGVGAKMWPMSSPKTPKQFLPLVQGKSLFEINWKMLRQRYQPEEIYIQTNHEQSILAKSIVSEILEGNILLEPESRNQGPATGLIAALLSKNGMENEPFFLIQVDNLRTPTDNFFNMVDTAEKLALETSKYITGGFRPKKIIKGVDFLKKGKLVQDGEVKVYEVDDYVDRNESDRIKSLFESGDLLVHANHTTMTPKNLLYMFEKHRPDWFGPLKKIVEGSPVSEEFGKMTKGALEEVAKIEHRAGNSLVIELPFEWTDFGTWESLESYYLDNGINAKNGGVVEIESKNNFCFSDSGKKISVIGLDDIIVVEGSEGILVCKRDLSGRVNEVV